MAATMVIDPGVDGWEIVNIDDFRETRTDHGDTPSFIGYPNDTPSQEFLDGVAVALGASGWMTTKEIGKDILGNEIKALYTVTGKPDFWDIRDETDFDGNPMYVEYYGEMGNYSNSVEVDVEADGDKIKDGKGYGYTIYEYRITTPLASAYSDDWDIEQALGEAEDWCRNNARIYDFEEEFDDYDDLFASKGDNPCAHANVFSKKSTDLGEGNSMHTSHDHVQGGLPDPSRRTVADSDRFEFWDDDEYTGYYGVPGDMDQSISWNIEDTYDSKWEVGYTVPNGWEFKVIGCTDTYEQARELLGTFLNENAEALLDGSYTAARKGKRTTANEDDYFYWGDRDFDESDPEFQSGLLAEFYYGLPDKKVASFHIKVRKTDDKHDIHGENGRIADVYPPLENESWDESWDDPEYTYLVDEWEDYRNIPSSVLDRMVDDLDCLLDYSLEDHYTSGSKAASEDIADDYDDGDDDDNTSEDTDKTASSDDYEFWGEHLPYWVLEDPEAISTRTINYGVVDNDKLSVTIESYGSTKTGQYTEINNVFGETMGTIINRGWDKIDQDFLESPVYNDVVNFLDTIRSVTQASLGSQKVAQPNSEYFCHGLKHSELDDREGFFYYGPSTDPAWSCDLRINLVNERDPDDDRLEMELVNFWGWQMGNSLPVESVDTAIQEFENSPLIQVASDYLDVTLPEEGWPEAAMASKHAGRDFVYYDETVEPNGGTAYGTAYYGIQGDHSRSLAITAYGDDETGFECTVATPDGEVVDAFNSTSWDMMKPYFEDEVGDHDLDGRLTDFIEGVDGRSDPLQQDHTSGVRKSSRTAKRKMTMKEKLALINEEKLEDEPFLGML